MATRKSAKKAAKVTTKRPAKKAAETHRDPFARIRAICMALPATAEVETWGEPTFRLGGKIFAMCASPGTHHTADRPSVWLMSVSLEQDMVLRARPDRYFKPPYVGPRGWIGVYLDRNPPWAEVEELVRDAWRRRAPKKLAALLGD